MMILTVVCIKYKPAYEVSLYGERLGYVKDKDKIELKIKNQKRNDAGLAQQK